MSMSSVTDRENHLNKEPSTESNDTQINTGDLTSLVASHYNQIKEVGLGARNKSRILYLRNFNNWVKSTLIAHFLEDVHRSCPNHINVLDIGCGKGGDLRKWEKGEITHLICADIADISIEQCRNRYNLLKNQNRSRKLFTAEFIAVDCTKVQLKEYFNDPSIVLNLVSCQFSFHYCFESLPQAECMLQNISQCLQPGGYFIGTIPDAYEIVSRYSKSGKSYFGNDIYKIKLDCNTETFPLFGAKYDFNLEGVVDCPEFLVHFPTFVELAKRYGFILKMKKTFTDFFEMFKDKGKDLLQLMKALETYPPIDEKYDLLQGSKEEYKHADEYLKNVNANEVGTMSFMEWEATSLYLVFAFQKQ